MSNPTGKRGREIIAYTRARVIEGAYEIGDTSDLPQLDGPRSSPTASSARKDNDGYIFSGSLWQLRVPGRRIPDDQEDDSTPSYAYPGGICDAWVPGLAVLICDQAEKKWVGHSSAGKESPKGLSLCCAHPDGKGLIVVSHGTAFVVPATDPSTWMGIEVRPILGYCAENREKDLVLYGYTDMVGMRADGTMWRTSRLSWDGLRSVRIVNSFVLGEGWDGSKSAFVLFEVDVTTGASTGGAAPPNLTASH